MYTNVLGMLGQNPVSKRMKNIKNGVIHVHTIIQYFL